ncbi:hypothetical protein SRHO_G00209680 [Serrasalmus rhombeus]
MESCSQLVLLNLSCSLPGKPKAWFQLIYMCFLKERAHWRECALKPRPWREVGGFSVHSLNIGSAGHGAGDVRNQAENSDWSLGEALGRSCLENRSEGTCCLLDFVVGEHRGEHLVLLQVNAPHVESRRRQAKVSWDENRVVMTAGFLEGEEFSPPAGPMEVPVLVLMVMCWVSVWADDRMVSDRHAVYWNSSNSRYELFC